jgi:3-deoxy-manno-octulosonate cytidylyltransferase (CMP-KDO synthetase)
MNFLGIIPSRFASSRFPGKPLAVIGGKTMIQWVYERSSMVLDAVYVATDDERIRNEVISFGGRVVMTSEHHKSGTDRCNEALELISKESNIKWDVVINIQGDEPFIKPEQIELLQKCFDDEETDIATLIKPVEDAREIFDENKPKVITDARGFAIMFSRSPIPFIRGAEKEKWIKKFTFHRHIGIYAYRTEVLKKISTMEPSALEIAESLEQLRWLENGLRIKVQVTPFGPLGIDTPEDLDVARRFFEQQNT